MRRKLDSLEALLSNDAANLDKQTVCTVQSAPSSMESHLMWARFMVFNVVVVYVLLVCILINY